MPFAIHGDDSINDKCAESTAMFGSLLELSQRAIPKVVTLRTWWLRGVGLDVVIHDCGCEIRHILIASAATFEMLSNIQSGSSQRNETKTSDEA